MPLGGARGDYQAVGDCLIGQAFGDQYRDLALPLGQSRRSFGSGPGIARRLFVQGVGDRRIKVEALTSAVCRCECCVANYLPRSVFAILMVDTQMRV